MTRVCDEINKCTGKLELISIYINVNMTFKSYMFQLRTIMLFTLIGAYAGSSVCAYYWMCLNRTGNIVI